MRWIDYLPEIARKEPAPRTEDEWWPIIHLGLTAEQFERAAENERIQKQYQEWMEQMYTILMQNFMMGTVNIRFKGGS